MNDIITDKYLQMIHIELIKIRKLLEKQNKKLIDK